jgi:phosphopantetheinyl transferase
VIAPVASPPRLSTSCRDDRVVIALSGGSLGVDIESPDHADRLDGARRLRALTAWEQVADVCPPHSSAVEVWTALEALSKTTGRGLMASPYEFGAAIAGHRLTWIPDVGGRVICVAAADCAHAVTMIDLRMT